MFPLSWRNLVIPVLLLAAVFVYLPGLNGPYLFDDHPNLLENKYLLFERFDFDSLRQAAFSQTSGPLYRPVAMASFAINAHLAGGFESPVSYRVVNIAIHILNGFLVYVLLRLVLQRLRKKPPDKRTSATPSIQSDHWLSAALAFLWLVLPIQVASVLYVVQRMTLLATLFTLLALCTYLIGRMRVTRDDAGGYGILISGPVVFGVLGVLSKETALLLPVFIVLLECMLFRTERPWKRWRRLSSRAKWLFAGGAALTAVVIMTGVLNYALGGYASRPFTMSERVLTEARVLILYLSLIVFPRLDDLGMFHDDIALSVSLLDPPSTALALLASIGLLGLAVVLIRRAPLAALGITWFFAGHLLESTIFPLEIAHEHRNYLPSFGLPLILAGLANTSMISINRKWWPIFFMAMGTIFAGVTFLRASQWSSEETLYMTEVRHHPGSHRAHVGLGTTLINRGRAAEGIAILRRASELAKNDPGTPISLAVFGASHGMPVDAADLKVIETRLIGYPISATTMRALMKASDCVLANCSAIAPYFERWLRILLNKHSMSPEDDSCYYHFLGRALLAQGKLNEAVDAYRTSYEHNPQYLVPLLDIAQVYLATGRLDYARVIAAEVRRANRHVRLPRNHELRELEHALEETNRGTR